MTALPIAPTEFSLHDLVVDEMARNASANPYVIAERVIDRIVSLSDAKAALAKALPMYVRNIAGNTGVAPPRIVTGGSQHELEPHVPGAPSGPGTGRAHTDAIKGAQRAGANRRRAWLAHRHPGVDGVWKFQGDFTEADCLAAAAVRHAKAAETAAAAKWFENVARLLVEHKAVTVKELPEEVLDGLS